MSGAGWEADHLALVVLTQRIGAERGNGWILDPEPGEDFFRLDEKKVRFYLVWLRKWGPGPLEDGKSRECGRAMGLNLSSLLKTYMEMLSQQLERNLKPGRNAWVMGTLQRPTHGTRESRLPEGCGTCRRDLMEDHRSWTLSRCFNTGREHGEQDR